jgi:hypothetical protein
MPDNLRQAIEEAKVSRAERLKATRARVNEEREIERIAREVLGFKTLDTRH